MKKIEKFKRASVWMQKLILAAEDQISKYENSKNVNDQILKAKKQNLQTIIEFFNISSEIISDVQNNFRHYDQSTNIENISSISGMLKKSLLTSNQREKLRYDSKARSLEIWGDHY